MELANLDLKIIAIFNKLFLPFARLAIFIVYFWFGILKLFNLSPAAPIAKALTAQTIGLSHYNLAFNILAIFECLIGILFLFPKATRVVIPLLLVHLIIVCSPLILVAHLVWTKPFVLTLDGQYIIKNLVIGALAIGIAAQTRPLQKKKPKS